MEVSFFMRKFSYEFKLELVEAYLSGKGGLDSLARKHNASPAILKRWVYNYRHFGPESLLPSQKKQIYPFEFKLYAVELYLTTKASYREVALTVGMNNPAVISHWVKVYRNGGPDALAPKPRGKKMKKQKKKTTSTSDNEMYLKQLEEENLKLRIENAFLKELRRLSLEEETLLREKRESFTDSEENSN